jgi:hypothetical protein
MPRRPIARGNSRSLPSNRASPALFRTASQAQRQPAIWQLASNLSSAVQFESAVDRQQVYVDLLDVSVCALTSRCTLQHARYTQGALGAERMRRDAVVRRHPHALDTSVIEMCDAAVSLCVRVRGVRPCAAAAVRACGRVLVKRGSVSPRCILGSAVFREFSLR